VQGLRNDAGWAPALSLVAVGPTGEVVGHVVCTVGSLKGAWTPEVGGPFRYATPFESL
jgi:predicted N-acetyltransferase YhbS